MYFFFNAGSVLFFLILIYLADQPTGSSLRPEVSVIAVHGLSCLVTRGILISSPTRD